MRKYLLAMAACACMVSTLHAQDKDKEKDKDWKDKPKIEGSGNVVTKEYPVSSFDQLSIAGVFNVILSQGSKEEVKIEADDNLQQLFEVKNDGSSLTIGMKKDMNFNSKKKMKVYVTFKKLKSMDLKTVGDISSDQNMTFDDLKISTKSVGSIDLKMTAQHLDVDNKSVGDIKLNGKAENAVIHNKSVGALKAGDFIVQSMDIDNKGIGTAEVNAVKELKVNANFLGKVVNKGSAPVKKNGKIEI